MPRADIESKVDEHQNWSSSPADLSTADHLESLLRDLAELSGLERLEEVTPLLRRSSMLSVDADGILEARAPSGAMLGVSGVVEALLECSKDAECTLERIESAVHRFEQDRRPDDDQTLVVVHRAPAEA